MNTTERTALLQSVELFDEMSLSIDERTIEILDHRLSPARFITDYIAGLYQRPLFAPSSTDRAASNASATRDFSPSLLTSPSFPVAHLYVNRGLGTVGAPVRLGVPPEISLIVLRRA